MSRALSETFLKDLTSGFLHPLLAEIQQDDTLMLGLRGTYLNVYYRGGSILRLEQIPGALQYRAFFDKNYAMGAAFAGCDHDTVANSDHADAWARAFKDLKHVMNRFLVKYPKPEREFQQLVAWENNRSGLANQTEYFVTDIEFASTELRARFDMLGVKWLSTDRQTARHCRPVLFEMKYGDASLTGGSGLLEHLDDITNLLKDPRRREDLSKMVLDQFNQLNSLGLLKYNKSSRLNEGGLTGFEEDYRPELVFLLANHNPRSKALLNVLEQIATSEAIREATDFDLKFYVATFAGYAMHHASMVELEKFTQLVRQLAPRVNAS
jgi:hypothetical protein